MKLTIGKKLLGLGIGTAVLTLVATPVAYSLFDDARGWLAARRRTREGR